MMYLSSDPRSKHYLSARVCRRYAPPLQRLDELLLSDKIVFKKTDAPKRDKTRYII